MSGHQEQAYPPGQGLPPPHPSQSAYPPPMPGGFVPPPGGQTGYGAPPPGQPGYGAPPPGQPGYGAPPPGQPGYGAPPPGSFPPGYGGAPSYGMPPPAYSGPAPSGVAVPPGTGYPEGASYPYPGGAAGYPPPPGFKQSSGNDSDDSQPGDPGLRSRGGSKKIRCTFVNHADTKVKLCRIDEKGKFRKVLKLKDGKKEVVDTFEGDVFIARGKRRRKRLLVINNNVLFSVMAEKDGEDKVKAEILQGPDNIKELASEKKNDVEVKVKFINRSKKTAQLVWINPKGKREKIKAIAPGKCYTTKTHECNSWIAHEMHDEDDGLYLNYSIFYSPWKTRKHKERVLITQDRPWGDSGSSSSDSD